MRTERLTCPACQQLRRTAIVRPIGCRQVIVWRLAEVLPLSASSDRPLRNVKALDVVSVGLRGDNMDEWGALVRISFLVDDVTDE